MNSHYSSSVWRLVLGMSALWISIGELALAQGTTSGGSTTTTSTTVAGVSGVIVDPQGVLRTKIYGDKAGRVALQRIAAARAQLPPDLAAPSKLRKVSLTKLERAVREAIDAGKKPTEEMVYLAGLTRIQYVFAYPESNEVVIAGPAEGWAADLSGRVVGLETGRPTLQLQDVIAALRTYPPNGGGAPVISCSIDPTKEGLANFQQYFAVAARRLTPNNPAQARMMAKGIQDSLGLQVVTLTGISPRTHFAQVLVEADYRMKLIGIGLERTPVKIASYVDLAKPGSGGLNSMQRWYFVPDYECLRVSDDQLSMEIAGQGVKLVNQDEVVRPDGSRGKSGNVDGAGRKFVDGFTKKFPDLAAAVPVYAELRNMIDLSIVAAFMQQQNFYQKTGWEMKTFGDESICPVETEIAPTRVETAVNVVSNGRSISFPMGGGVRIEPRHAFESSNLLTDEDGTISELRQATTAELNQDHWWWD